MRNKTIGIIGGFGPEGTAEFYLRLVDKHRTLHHGLQPDILIRNVAVPRHLEEELLIHGRSIDKFAPLLVAAAKNLEKNGADVIALPCNTLHIHEETIQTAIDVPFVSIIQSTVQFFSDHNITRVGFLGSGVTIRENLFKKKAQNISFITVDERLQKRINTGLDIFVENQKGELLERALRDAFTFIRRTNAKDVLLACTDFGTLCPRDTTFHVHDTLDILVEATVNML